jgi:NAD(P)H-hydrate epimerase
VLNLEAPQEQSPVGFRVGEAEQGREPEGGATQAKKGKEWDKEREKERVGFRTGTPAGTPGTTSGKAEAETSSEASTPNKRPPLVLDADGLNILATIENWHEQFPREECILTPHPGEMKRLLNVDELGPDLVAVATDAAARWGQVLVLKGATTVIAAPDGRSVVHTAGNPALATAGTGDVLAGVLAGLLAQGMTLFDAAVLGVYLHAQAGDLVRETLGDTGALASDLLPNLPKVIKQIRGK